MTDSFVTQCPHCQTSFRVSHAQLSVARGVVRCGSCLQVFNAARQLLEQRAGKDAVAAPSTPPPLPNHWPRRHREPSARSSGAPPSSIWTASTWTRSWPSSNSGKSSRPRPSARSAHPGRTPSAPAATSRKPKRNTGPTACSASPPAAAMTSMRNPSRPPSTPAGPGVPNRRCPSTSTIWKTNPKRPPCSRMTTWSPCQRTVP